MKKEKIDKETVYRQFGWKYEDGDYYHDHRRPPESKIRKLFSEISKFIKKLLKAFKKDAKQRLFSMLFFILFSDEFDIFYSLFP